MKFGLKSAVMMAVAGMLLLPAASSAQDTIVADFENGVVTLPERSSTKNTIAMNIDSRLSPEQKQAGVFTPEVMWQMGRIGSVAVSPDGTKVVYTTTYYDVEQNRGYTSLFMIEGNGSQPVRLTDDAGNDGDPVWLDNSRELYFLSDRGGDDQAWKIDVESRALTQVSFVEGGIEAFGIAPQTGNVFYIKSVHAAKRAASEIYEGVEKSKVLIYDDLMARHWNYWDRGDYRHIFITKMENGRFSEGRDIMEGELWDAPMAPYFDSSEISWDNTGMNLAYTCKKMTGLEYATSTDSDIYWYTGQGTANVTAGNVGYDKYPVFSPDNRYMAYLSMERPGNEADKDRLMVLDLQTSDLHYLTEHFDYNAQNVVWEDNTTILFIAPINGTHQICRANIGQGSEAVEILTRGEHDLTSFSLGEGRLVATMTKMSMAAELFDVDLKTGELTQISFVNKEVYDNIPMGRVEGRWVETTDGKQMLVWVTFPPNFDPNKKYPALLYCQGGPQSVVSQFWSYRWNMQLMAAQGYIVVAPNRRGLPSFGQEWLDQISGDYSGQNIRDYLSAIDNVAREPWCDEDRLGCVGASYGGYSVFFLAGNHEGRFKGFISHCGIFDFDSMYGSTEELFFVNNDYGGSYWSNDPVARRSYANSPHKFVDKWDTPILIITGLRDFRIPYTQSLEAFTAARVKGLPARLLAFEDEAHQVFKPQNSLVWNREFFGWLDKYVKNAEK